MLKPKEHQIAAEKWMEDKDKVILALDMGLGKTMLGARAINPGERTLLLCPASMKINWRLEINMWRPDIKNIYTAKKKSETLPKGNGVIIMNFDLMGQRKKCGRGYKAVANYDFSDFDTVIIDESHLIKNPKAVRTKLAGRIIIKAKRAVLLTGTLMERPIDLYVPLYSIGALGKMKMHTFGDEYCDPALVWIGRRQIVSYRGCTNPEELRKLMEPQTLIMYKEDVIDLPEKEIQVVALDLPVSKKEKAYDLNEIKKDPRPIGFEGLAELLHEQGLSKVPLAVQHIKMRMETNHKLFVTARHTDVINLLAEKLKEFNPVIIDGRTKCKQTEKDKFQTDPKYRICIGQTKAAGVGLTLTAAHHVVIVEPDWSYSALMQLIDRCHRIGQKNNVTAELLTIHNSICERVLYTTLEKKQYVNLIMKGE